MFPRRVIRKDSELVHHNNTHSLRSRHPSTADPSGFLISYPVTPITLPSLLVTLFEKILRRYTHFPGRSLATHSTRLEISRRIQIWRRHLRRINGCRAIAPFGIRIQARLQQGDGRSVGHHTYCQTRIFKGKPYLVIPSFPDKRSFLYSLITPTDCMAESRIPFLSARLSSSVQT